jgi:uncharacterized protein involved in exopolysaccharide biosynthesis
MGLKQLLWRRRWVLLLGAVISAGAAVPALMNAPKGFTSEAQVLVAPAEPVEPAARGATPLAEALSAYESAQLPADLRAELGDDADAVESIDVTLNREEGLHVIGIEATSSDIAARGAATAAELVVDESHRLGFEQVQTLDANVSVRLDSLQQERFEAHRDRAQAAANSPNGKPKRSAVIDFESRLDVIQAKREGLLDLVREASSRLAIRQATTQLVSGPTPPESNFPTRVIETVGLALVVGVVVATLTILWLERRSLVPPAAPPQGGTDGQAAHGLLHPGTARGDDEEHTAPRVVHR